MTELKFYDDAPAELARITPPCNESNWRYVIEVSQPGRLIMGTDPITGTPVFESFICSDVEVV